MLFRSLAFAAQADTEGLALFENPEDLGAVKSGENQGNRPSSMWQWLDFDTLLKRRASQQRLFTNKILGQSTSNRQDFYSASLGSCPHFFCKGNHSLITRDTTWDRCSREQQRNSSLVFLQDTFKLRAQSSGHQKCANGLLERYWEVFCKNIPERNHHCHCNRGDWRQTGQCCFSGFKARRQKAGWRYGRTEILSYPGEIKGLS